MESLSDTPASTQTTESHINPNTMNGRMRVAGRVTHPSKSTPTGCRYVTVMKRDEGRQVIEWDNSSKCFLIRKDGSNSAELLFQCLKVT